MRLSEYVYNIVLFGVSLQGLIIFPKVNWVVSPLSMVVAQQFIPVEVGEPHVRRLTELTQL